MTKVIVQQIVAILFLQFWCVQLKLGVHKRLNSFYISPYLDTVKSLQYDTVCSAKRIVILMVLLYQESRVR